METIDLIANNWKIFKWFFIAIIIKNFGEFIFLIAKAIYLIINIKKD